MLHIYPVNRADYERAKKAKSIEQAVSHLADGYKAPNKAASMYIKKPANCRDENIIEISEEMVADVVVSIFLFFYK